MEILVGLLLLGVFAFLVACIGGLAFFLIWNDFVVNHLDGAHHTSFGAAILVGVAIALLTAGAKASVTTS